MPLRVGNQDIQLQLVERVGRNSGGFLLLVCERSRQPELRQAMSQWREIRFGLETQGSQVIYCCDEMGATSHGALA